MRRLRLVGLSGDGRDVVFIDDAERRVRCSRRRQTPRGPSRRPRPTRPVGDRDGQRPAPARHPGADPCRADPRQRRRARPGLGRQDHAVLRPGAGRARARRRRRPVAASSAARTPRGRPASSTEVVAEKLREPRTRPDDRRVGRLAARRRSLVGAGPLPVRRREHAATFVYDAVGRYSIADDDEAKWLTGEKQATRKGPQPREAAPEPRGCRAGTWRRAPPGRGPDRRGPAVPDPRGRGRGSELRHLTDATGRPGSTSRASTRSSTRRPTHRPTSRRPLSRASSTRCSFRTSPSRHPTT